MGNLIFKANLELLRIFFELSFSAKSAEMSKWTIKSTEFKLDYLKKITKKTVI